MSAGPSSPAMKRGVDFKLVLLGAAGVGKTTLVNMLLNHEFGYNPATIGALFSFYSYKGVAVGIWDTAGSDHYDSISSLYCRGASVAFLVYSITSSQSFRDLKKYYEKLLNTTSDCHIIVVGTMLDLVKEDEKKRDVAERAGQAYASSIGADFFEVSSKIDLNVNEVFQIAVERYLAKARIQGPMSIPRNILVNMEDEESRSNRSSLGASEKSRGCNC
eukprot:TRINITY_DN1919_c0_g1_i1.p1 TRINITY_DN1919_c0_g1~~TRINITY_DN1919_c0_g1_i1.p1  ORF type:complete len:218 (-),score=39.93 TRINITY_DN1919_c0_g1_i1:751-1404(-)